MLLEIGDLSFALLVYYTISLARFVALSAPSLKYIPRYVYLVSEKYYSYCEFS